MPGVVALHSALKYVCLVFSYETVFYQSSFTTFWRIIAEKHLDPCQRKSHQRCLLFAISLLLQLGFN